MYVYSQFDVESHFQGRLKIAYLNQPETMNALNKPLLAELREFVEFYDKDPDTRCIVISGKGKAFCSGQMLDEQLLNTNVNIGREVQKIVVDYYNPLVNSINYCSKPVISLVNGLAVGAGAVLALICDFSVATSSAYFSLGFSNIGLIPDTGGTYYLPKIMNRQMAHYLAYTGKKLSAEEARNLGYIAEVFSDDEFTAKSMEMLENIVNMPTKALGLTKKAFRKSYRYSLKEQLDLESVYQADAARSEDFKEGIDAFLEKRKPIFKGK
jgi:2-(1,2-epoxy-1,2-dihydrophenyl)acetyl-CoA isomerase